MCITSTSIFRFGRHEYAARFTVADFFVCAMVFVVPCFHIVYSLIYVKMCKHIEFVKPRNICKMCEKNALDIFVFGGLLYGAIFPFWYIRLIRSLSSDVISFSKPII